MYKKFEILFILILVVGIGFLLRARLRETYESWQRASIQSSLPQAQSYAEVQQLQNINDGEVQNVDEVTNATSNAPAETTQKNLETEQLNTLEFANESAMPQEQTTQDTTEIKKPNAIIPESINLAVPFTSQAPYANWALPYQEACEEAAALMVHAFYTNLTLDPARADKKILDLVDFQEQYYGFYKDTTAQETARFIQDLWGYTNVRVEPAKIETIKAALTQGFPVMIPAAGRMLGNPYFTGEGPLYHMLVIRGYTKDDNFITNDPGTKRGEGYVYKASTLMNAIHDWNNGNVESGEKLMIIIEPN